MKVYALSMSNMNLDMVYPLWFTEAQKEKIDNDFVKWYINNAEYNMRDELVKIKSLFAKFGFEKDFSKTNFMQHFSELRKVIEDNDIRIELNDGKYKYTYTDDGWEVSKEIYGEYHYYPMIVMIKERLFFYSFEKYDIDDDIERFSDRRILEITEGEAFAAYLKEKRIVRKSYVNECYWVEFNEYRMEQEE